VPFDTARDAVAGESMKQQEDSMVIVGEPLARDHHRALTRNAGEETALARRARQLARTH
jgi:hypothetical protein